MDNPSPRRVALATGVVALLAVIFLQIVFLAQANSATWDEPDHIYSAYMQATQGDFGLNPEHPPLVKFLGVIPILGGQYTMPPLEDRFYRLQEAAGGREFLFQNDANSILFRVRMATSILTILLALLVFLATQEMFGSGAGLIALSLLAFDPTLLAHSALFTTDAAQACFMFWAVYAFYRYAKQPTLLRLIAVALIAGLALASKHSCVLLLPMLILLALVEVIWPRQPIGGQATGLGSRTLRYTIVLCVITILSVGVLWSFYGFRYAARVDTLPLNPSFDAQMAKVPSTLERGALIAEAHLHLLPESYLYGFAHVLAQSNAFTSFVLGVTYPHPVWFYFPIAIFIKSSLTFLLLLGISLVVIATGRLRAWREILYLAIPAALYFAFAMAGGMNIGIRHILPVYVFLTALIGGAAWQLIRIDRKWLYLVVALLIFQAASVLRAFPDYIAYANEAFGGPKNDHNLLSDSSSDWGQQLKSVKRYIDRNHIHDCWFAYFGQGVADFRYYGIPCKPLITADSLFFDGPHDVPPAIDGPVFMSAGVLAGFEFGPSPLNAYEQFKQLRPAAVIDSSVFVYNGHFDIPLAAALSNVQKSGILLGQHQPAAALAEAQQAESQAPESAPVNATLARALDANNRPAEALPYYRKALALAQANQPAFQQNLIKSLQQRLAAS
jgi:tetratricopeptide (TPR) repeat protein